VFPLRAQRLPRTYVIPRTCSRCSRPRREHSDQHVVTNKSIPYPALTQCTTPFRHHGDHGPTVDLRANIILSTLTPRTQCIVRSNERGRGAAAPRSSVPAGARSGSVRVRTSTRHVPDGLAHSAVGGTRRRKLGLGFRVDERPDERKSTRAPRIRWTLPGKSARMLARVCQPARQKRHKTLASEFFAPVAQLDRASAFGAEG
jgi:hypothetical protein